MRAKWRVGAALAVVLSAAGSARAFYFEGWPGSGVGPLPTLAPSGPNQSVTPGTSLPVGTPSGPTPGGPPGPIDMPPVGPTPTHTPEPSAGLFGLIGLGALGLRRLRARR